MSRTELERLARIRMQITGETLERAMAVLGGELTVPKPQSAREPGSEAESGPDEAADIRDTGATSEAGEAIEADADATAPGPAADPEPDRDRQRKAQRRTHLRGL
ncbi:hypothetical protein ACWD6P_02980 [Streptomyces sp. NPDC002446]